MSVQRCAHEPFIVFISLYDLTHIVESKCHTFPTSFVGESVEWMRWLVESVSLLVQIEKEKDVVPIRPLFDSAPLITVDSCCADIDELDVTLSEHESD